jgi:XisH protein
VDLGAERLLAAEKAQVKIAVEVKSFLSPSRLNDLEQALGQFILYHDLLEINEPERILFVAMPIFVRSSIIEEPIGRLLIQKGRLRILVFDPVVEEVVQWIPTPPSEKS